MCGELLHFVQRDAPWPKSYSHIDFKIALAKQMIGTFSNQLRNPISQPLYVGPGTPNEQFINHQNKNSPVWAEVV